MNPPHDHGHRSVYHAGCDDCLVIDLARSPDVRVRATLKAIKAERGSEAVQALVAAVQRARLVIRTQGATHA